MGTGSDFLGVEPVWIGVVPLGGVEPLVGVDGEYDGTRQDVGEEQDVKDSKFGEGASGQEQLSLVEKSAETIREFAELVAEDGHGIDYAGTDGCVDQRKGVVGKVHLVY